MRLFTLLLLSSLLLVRASAVVVADFSDPAEVARWKFSNGPEFPGARGALVQGPDAMAELQYDFTPIVGSTGPFDPHYVMATRSVSTLGISSVAAVRIDCWFSNIQLGVAIRLYDATGQTFQIPLTAQVMFERENFVGTYVGSLVGSAHWGGANDGVFHAPLNRVSIVLDASKRRDIGWARFSNLRIDTVPQVEANRQDISSYIIARPSVEIANPNKRVGVCVHFTKDDFALDLISSSGLGWVRADLNWSVIERTPSVYNFTEYDKLLDAAQARGLSMLGILDYGNLLYTSGVKTGPASPSSTSAFVNYSKAVAARYKDRPLILEVWNESDLDQFWQPKADVDAYSNLLKSTVLGVRSIAPSITLLPSGLSSITDKTRLYWDAMESKNSFTGTSGFSSHLYGSSIPETRWQQTQELQVRRDRVLPGKPVYCTEWGYSTTDLSATKNGADPVAREKQARYYARMILTAWRSDLALITLYDMRDNGTNPADREHNFGLLAYDYSEKPAMKAVRTLLTLAKGRTWRGLMTAPGKPERLHVALLENNFSSVYAVWLEDGGADCDIQVPDRRAKVYDMKGALLTPERKAEIDTVKVTEVGGPIYIEVPK